MNINNKTVMKEESVVYLGSSLTADGRMNLELGRRIGASAADFRTIRHVWKHSSLPIKHRLKVYRSLIESKLMYALPTGCFTKAELRRLDGFQGRCLRQVLKTQSSFLSRVTNADVLQRAGFEAASVQLRKRQMIMLGKVLRQPQESDMREATFSPSSSLQPVTDRFVRRTGAPRKEWVRSVLPDALRLAGGSEKLSAAIANASQWRQQVHQATFQQ